jgi:hypothetical protein
MATKDWKKKSRYEYVSKSKEHYTLIETGEPHSIKKGKKIYSVDLTRVGPKYKNSQNIKVLFKSPSIMKTHAFGRKYRKSHSK